MSGFLRAAPPARQPEAPELPVDRTYRVIGPREVGGGRQGELVVMCLTRGQEQALIDAGHIEVVAETKPPMVSAKKASPKAR